MACQGSFLQLLSCKLATLLLLLLWPLQWRRKMICYGGGGQVLCGTGGEKAIYSQA